MTTGITVAFWGTRGTIPSPGAATVRYGGNTPCVSVRDPAGRTVILDAGTGIRPLGLALGDQRTSRLDLFLSHAHWDHIQGLPFFAPMYVDGQEIRIHGPTPPGISLQAVLDRQLEAAVHPVPPAARGARLTVEEIGPGAVVAVPGFEVRSIALSHPGGALGYRVTPAGGEASVAYVTDNELGGGGASRVGDSWLEDLTAFVSGATLLIHDGMYTPGQLEERSGWGHSSALEAVALAASAGVAHLALFHHEPGHADGQVDSLLAMAQAAAPAGLTVSAAREGTTVTL